MAMKAIALAGPMLLAGLLMAGCSTVRSGLGEYQKAADKGIELRVGSPPPDAAADAGADTRGNANLPSSLGGDSENRSYLPAQPPKHQD